MNKVDEGYISRQISVYKTSKKLIEFNDKLNIAPIASYAHIHAQADDMGGGKKLYSNIGVVLQDYTTGVGEKTVRVSANISPDEAQFIFSRVQMGVESFDFKQEKIFGAPDKNGKSIVTKLRVLRASTDSKGQTRDYPWYIEIENGAGVPVKNASGGIYCKGKSFISASKVYININDLDFFKLMNRVSQYITAWETAVGPALIKKGRLAMEEKIQAAKIG